MDALDVGFLGDVWKTTGSWLNRPRAPGLVQPLQLTDKEIEVQRGEGGVFKVTQLVRNQPDTGPMFSDFPTSDVSSVDSAICGQARPPSSPSPLPGEGEVPEHSEQVHGDPRHCVL